MPLKKLRPLVSSYLEFDGDAIRVAQINAAVPIGDGLRNAERHKTAGDDRCNGSINVIYLQSQMEGSGVAIA